MCLAVRFGIAKTDKWKRFSLLVATDLCVKFSVFPFSTNLNLCLQTIIGPATKTGPNGSDRTIFCKDKSFCYFIPGKFPKNNRKANPLSHRLSMPGEMRDDNLINKSRDWNMIYLGINYATRGMVGMGSPGGGKLVGLGQ